MTDRPPARATLEKIADNVHELIDPMLTSEPIAQPALVGGKWRTVKSKHDLTHATLLDQLRSAVEQASSDGEWGGGEARSKPAASLDAIATLERIRKQSDEWLTRTFTTRRVGLEARLSSLIGAATRQDPISQKDLAKVTRSWVVEARIVTGWDRRPFEPDVPCPNIECERRSTLRIRLDQGIATCTECHTYWDTDNIQRLGMYVRWATEHLKDARHWQIDAEGYPVECMECLGARQEMGIRAAERLKKLREERDTGKVSA